jgi:hypothetical protein
MVIGTFSSAILTLRGNTDRVRGKEQDMARRGSVRIQVDRAEIREQERGFTGFFGYGSCHERPVDKSKHSILYRLTDHARDALLHRDIPREWMERVLSDPEIVYPDARDSTLMHALGRIPEGKDKILRVVYNHTHRPIWVVTVFFDRRVREIL